MRLCLEDYKTSGQAVLYPLLSSTFYMHRLQLSIKVYNNIVLLQFSIKVNNIVLLTIYIKMNIISSHSDKEGAHCNITLCQVAALCQFLLLWLRVI